MYLDFYCSDNNIFSIYCTDGQLLEMSAQGGVTLYSPGDNETTVLINSTRLVSCKEKLYRVSRNAAIVGIDRAYLRKNDTVLVSTHAGHIHTQTQTQTHTHTHLSLPHVHLYCRTHSQTHSQGELKEMYGTISKIQPSPSTSQLLLIVNQTKVYRHSFLADYLLYDIENG